MQDLTKISNKAMDVINEDVKLWLELRRGLLCIDAKIGVIGKSTSDTLPLISAFVGRLTEEPQPLGQTEPICHTRADNRQLRLVRSVDSSQLILAESDFGEDGTLFGCETMLLVLSSLWTENDYHQCTERLLLHPEMHICLVYVLNSTEKQQASAALPWMTCDIRQKISDIRPGSPLYMVDPEALLRRGFRSLVTYLEFIYPKSVTPKFGPSRPMGLNDFGEFFASIHHSYATTAVHIGVIGMARAGKSTFINAIRGLKDAEQPGAAPIGTIQTTIEVRPYYLPKCQNIIFWDLPGLGTPDFGHDAYITGFDFSQFDCYVLVNKKRFNVADRDLAKKIALHGRKFYFATTHMTQVMEDQKHGNEDFDELIELSDIRSYNKKQLEGIEGSHTVYLIDSYETNKFEFQQLKEKIISDMPDEKRNVMLLNMEVQTSFLLQKKLDLLRDNVAMQVLRAVCTIRFLTPRIYDTSDHDFIRQTAKSYITSMGLEQEHPWIRDRLRRNEDGTLVGLATTLERRVGGNLLTNEGVEAIMSPATKAFQSVGRFCKKIALILPAAGIAFGTNVSILKKVLAETEECSREILEKLIAAIIDEVATLDELNGDE